jgi:hypothetical protein
MKMLGAIVSLVGAFLLATAAPVVAANADPWVMIDGPVPYQTTNGQWTVKYVNVYVAETGTVPVPTNMNLAFQVSGPGSPPFTCSIGTQVLTNQLTPNRPALTAFRFQVAYPGPPASTTVPYTLHVNMTFWDIGDNLWGNNPQNDQQTLTVNFPAGGTPQCVKVLGAPHPASLASLTLSSASVTGGSGSTGKVTITVPAPPGGFPVALSSRIRDFPLASGIKPPVASVPQQVTIAAGATEATFPVGTQPVAADTAVPIMATAQLGPSRTATLMVRVPQVATLSFNPPLAFSGMPSTGTVTLYGPVAPGGTPVHLTFPPPNLGIHCGQLPTMPSVVQVAGGPATFPVTIYPGFVQDYLVEAYTDNPAVYAYAHFAVQQPGLSMSMLPSSVTGGTAVQGTLHLMGLAMPPDCGNTYKLQSSNPFYAQVPPSVTVPTGTSMATFTITTRAIYNTPQTVTISVFFISSPSSVVAPLTITP